MYPDWLVLFTKIYNCVIAGRVTAKVVVRDPDCATYVWIMGELDTKFNVLPEIASTSYVAEVNTTLFGVTQPTVMYWLALASKNIKPESPGFVLMEDDPLIVCGDGGVNDNAPDPLFLKAINQPVVSVATDGSAMLPSPPSQL